MLYNDIGIIALGSRLRMLSETITEDAKGIYNLYHVDLKPKWFPVFYVLSHNQEKPITAIANEIRHSHPSVSKIVSEMRAVGIVFEKKDKNDGRKNLIALTQKGKEISIQIKDPYTDVESAIELALSKTQHNIWKAMGEFEFLLNQKSLLLRVKEQKKKRESKKVKIISYTSAYQSYFKKLNKEWIAKYFKMETADYNALDNPKTYILDKGGRIIIALYNGEPVGVCALLKMDSEVYDFELAKMAVSPKAQGLGIGWLLGTAIIHKAKSLKAKNIYLESNTILKPAIQLYQKLGFKKVSGYPTPYERCNIQMVLSLKPDER